MGAVGEIKKKYEKRSTLLFAIKKYAWIIRKIIPERLVSCIKEFVIRRNILSFLNEKVIYRSDKYPMGVNLIGSIRTETGLGQSCRLVAGQLEQSGVKFSVYNVDFSVYNINFDGKIREKDSTYDKYITDELNYGINLVHVNPCELWKVFMNMSEAWNERYNIAFWLWELEAFPKEWIKYCTLFDEIWTPSDFAGQSIKKVTDVPVKTMPYCITAFCDPDCTRASFGLPDAQFLYLIMYDSNSTNGRKNPKGAIEAYKKAFPHECKECGLVIKINNAGEKDVDNLKGVLSGYQNIYFITEVLKKEQVNSLIKMVDVYISLHRAEGFGLVMAEAMSLGTPVIATNWSSNTEFMNEESSCMVKYQLVENPQKEGLYKKGCVWAEADIEDAASYILRLKQDRNYYMKKVKGGKNCIEEKLNKEYLSKLWTENLDLIYKSYSKQQN